VKVLLVEDDEDKRVQIRKFLHEVIGHLEVVEVKSFRSALRSIMSEQLDIVILDMTIPTFDIGRGEDGGRPQAFGGREILRHMQWNNIATPAVVVTQFDIFGVGSNAVTIAELDIEMRELYGSQYLGAISYNAASDDWKKRLAGLITGVTKDH
jgi:CheY-like chemotaxis protein